MTPIATLARAAGNTRWEKLPEAVRSQASALFLDTLAVISAGLTHSDYKSFADIHTRGAGEASIPGIDHGVPVLDAVLVNGGATTVLQLQDGHRLARGHPASHLVPALLASAEAESSSSASMLAAFVAGYEVGARVGIAMDGLNPALHDTGTWSTIAAAVAVTHLLTGGSPDLIARAIEAAAAVAPMPYRETAAAGASIHHLYVGFGASAGVSVGRAVAAGLQPLGGTLDKFFGPRAGAAWHPESLAHGIRAKGCWKDHELLNAYFKVHPTCAHLHGINDAVAQLIKENALVATEVERVDVATYAAALEFENATPINDLAGRFSIPGSVAIALCHGELTIHTLTSEALRAPAVQQLMQRIHVSHDPALDQHYPQGRPCTVQITCHDGRKLAASVIHPVGDCTNPLDADARRVKALALLGERFGHPVAKDIADAWDSVVAGEPLSELSRVLRATALR